MKITEKPHVFNGIQIQDLSQMEKWHIPERLVSLLVVVLVDVLSIDGVF